MTLTTRLSSNSVYTGQDSAALCYTGSSTVSLCATGNGAAPACNPESTSSLPAAACCRRSSCRPAACETVVTTSAISSSSCVSSHCTRDGRYTAHGTSPSPARVSGPPVLSASRFPLSATVTGATAAAPDSGLDPPPTPFPTPLVDTTRRCRSSANRSFKASIWPVRRNGPR